MGAIIHIIAVTTILLLISGCMRDVSEPNFNQTCQEKGYDYALPILMDDKVAGFNCCLEKDNRQVVIIFH